MPPGEITPRCANANEFARELEPGQGHTNSRRRMGIEPTRDLSTPQRF